MLRYRHIKQDMSSYDRLKRQFPDVFSENTEKIDALYTKYKNKFQSLKHKDIFPKIIKAIKQAGEFLVKDGGWEVLFSKVVYDLYGYDFASEHISIIWAIESATYDAFMEHLLDGKFDHMKEEIRKPYIEYYENGKIYRECTYTSDILEGTRKEYYESGVLKYEIVETLGSCSKKGYRESGVLEFELTETLDSYSRKDYYTSGNLYVESYRLKDGRVERIFYEDKKSPFDTKRVFHDDFN